MRTSDIRVDTGLRTLRGRALDTLTALDEVFAGWARDVGAESVMFPPLVRVEDLVSLDYLRNFPHLAFLVSPISSTALGSIDPHRHVACEDLEAAEYMLPPAACYSAYLDLRHQTLSAPRRVTMVATCFRHEAHFDALRRLMGFTMREIVCIGPREAVQQHLATFRERILGFVERLGLPAAFAAADDPFFDRGGPRALMQQLFPVKEELSYRADLAIASLNFHRNFFGERCDIRLADGEPAFSGCVAFGLERWVAALSEELGAAADVAALVRACADG